MIMPIRNIGRLSAVVFQNTGGRFSKAALFLVTCITETKPEKWYIKHMEAIKIFFLVMFLFMMALVVIDFIGEEKDKKLEPSE